MKLGIDNYEYEKIIQDILNNNEFRKIVNFKHHKTNRLDHSKRVSLYSYRICKRMGLDYISASRAGLLHDFFTDSYSKKNVCKLIKNHPRIALFNSLKYFELNDREKNIIESHMFPINIKVRPKYMESFIVSLVDKFVCIYEKAVGYFNEFNFKLLKTAIYVCLFIFN